MPVCENVLWAWFGTGCECLEDGELVDSIAPDSSLAEVVAVVTGLMLWSSGCVCFEDVGEWFGEVEAAWDGSCVSSLCVPRFLCTAVRALLWEEGLLDPTEEVTEVDVAVDTVDTAGKRAAPWTCAADSPSGIGVPDDSERREFRATSGSLVQDFTDRVEGSTVDNDDGVSVVTVEGVPVECLMPRSRSFSRRACARFARFSLLRATR